MQILSRLKSMLGGGRVDIQKRFELLREAVHGTMSNFYMARDRQTGNVVGLKVLDLKKTQKFEKRFQGLNKPSEGQIASSLRHPAIVETLEHGLTTRGEQFLVMEYLEGQGLNSLIHAKSQQLVENRVALLKEAASALQGVHDAGYIHRDICPRNFVVAANLKSLKLIDFGLTVPDTPPFRRPGNRTGTPKYMAPEVVRRRATDHRLDLFSFGITAYEMFAFAAPWPRTEATGKIALDHDKPPTPIGEFCPEIDADLAAAIHSCLAPNPQNRPPSADAFLARIQAVRV